MSVALDSLLARLATAGIQLRVEDGDRLRYRAPKGALTPELAEEIKASRDALLARLRTADAGAIIPRLPDAPHYALSQAQWRLWVLMQMDRDATAYNVPLHLEFRGPLEADRVAAVFTALVARHEALRTRFILVDGEPRQAISAPAPVELTRHTAASLTEARQLARTQTAAPFDLATGPLLRLGLVRLAPDHHILLLTLHHIIADGTSFGVLLREFGEAYNALGQGQPLPLAPLPLQYRDFAAWQNARLHDPALAAEGHYWRQQLQAPLPVLELPLDHPRPPVQTHAGREHTFTLDAATTALLTAFCQRGGATVFMGLVTLVKVLLHRYSGQTDLIVGSPIAGRTHPALQDQVGFYLNTLALRTTVDPTATLADQLRAVRRTVTAAFDHQDYPFDFLVNELGLTRDLSRSPLFDVMVILQNQDESGSPMPGLEVRSFIEPSATSKLDLTFYFKIRGDTLHAAIEYNPDLFAPDRIERMADHLANLTAALGAADQLTVSHAPLLGAAERTLVTRTYNPAPTPLEAHRTTRELIAATAAARPDHVAVRTAESGLTYADLWQQAGQLAAALVAAGVQPGDRVAVCLERTPALVVALLATWRAGAAYVPLDPGFPADRLAYVLEDAAVRLLIATPDTAASLQNTGVPTLAPDASATPLATDPALSPDALAYLLHTSGSTGRPKGVAIPHRGLTNFLQSMQQAPGLSAEDRLLAVTTVSFDIAGLELWLPLITGATIVLADRATAIDGHRILDTLTDKRVTFLQATPATWRLLLDAGWTAGQTPGLTIACGGEAMPGALARELLPRGRAIWNLYGPTETTVWSTAHRVTAADTTAALVTVGRPIANTTCFVVDAFDQPTPLGVPGELLIGGAGVADGYWQRAELTAQKFVTVPPGLAEVATERLYRTGDLVRWQSDGTLEFFGRTDHQVKLRGYRIELGEIEAVLADHPGVRVAAVVLHEEDLAAYVEPEAGTAPDLAAWRDHLRARLPDYMVPSRWTVLEALPLTANGKVDRRALPAPTDDGAAAATADFVAPRTPLEQSLAQLWSEVLERPTISADASFFELGGHSLKAARLVARLRRDLQLAANLADVFAHPILCDLAAHLALTESASAESDAKEADASPVPSVAQRRLWLLEQMRPGTAAYHMADTWWVEGEFDVDRLRTALRAVIARHDVLRTGFAPTDGDDPVAVAVQAEVEPALEVQDTRGASDPSTAALQLATAATARPFDFSRPPLLRVLVVRTGPQRHLVHWVMHHLISDAWSVNLLLRDLAAAYEGESDLVTPTPYQHFARRQHALLQSPAGNDLAQFWQEQLRGDLEPLALPTDHPRPAVMGATGRLHAIRFAAPTWQRLQALARAHDATDFMVLAALVSTLLHRTTTQSEIRLGVPVAGRDDAAWEHTVGFFINTVVLRTLPTPDLTATALLHQVRDTTLAALTHQAYPFDQLVDDLRLERDLSRHPLFDVSVQHAPRDLAPPALGGLAITRELPAEVPLKCDLAFDFGEEDGTLVCGLTYNPELFAADRIGRLADHLQVLADAFSRGPAFPIGELPLLPPAELIAVTETFSRVPAHATPPTSLNAWFESTAAAHADTLAFLSPTHHLTYAALEAEINALAVTLVDRGVHPGEVVGALTGRDPALPVALFAILRVGAIYLPLDPALPDARLAHLAADAKLRHAICTAACADRVPTGVSSISLPLAPPTATGTLTHPMPEPTAPATLIYTSGSTGQPKGVLVSHAAYVNTAREQIRILGLGPDTRMLQFANPSFDASLFELFGALLSGGTVLQVDEAQRIDPTALPDALRHFDVTHAVLPPSFVRTFEQAPLPLRVLLTAGEPAVVEDAQHYAQSLRFFNAYGPTEAAICSTMEEVAPDATFTAHSGVPIGRPLAGTELYVLDANLRPVPIGVDGEICVGGAGLADGYWQQPELTRRAFVPHPFVAGQRLYRTGDIGRWLPDGRVLCLGRRDGQIKLRGHRIEVGEIEHALRAHPAINEALVLLRRDQPERPVLMAYLIASAPSTPDELRDHLARTLPATMLPDAFVTLEAWPLTAAGKIDRRALPAPTQELNSAYVAPLDDVERLLAQTIATVLELPQVGRHDRFFQIGGNSLLALKVVTRVRQALRVELPVPLFFAHPSVAELGAALRPDSATRIRVDKVAAARAQLATMTPEQKRALLARQSAARQAQ